MVGGHLNCLFSAVEATLFPELVILPTLVSLNLEVVARRMPSICGSRELKQRANIQALNAQCVAGMLKPSISKRQFALQARAHSTHEMFESSGALPAHVPDVHFVVVS